MGKIKGVTFVFLIFILFSVSFAIPVITLGTPTNMSFSSDSLGGYPFTFYWPLNNTQTQTAIFGSNNWDSGTGAKIESSGDGFFQDLWIKGNLTVADITTLNVTGDLIPYLNDTFDLGNSTNWWNNIYVHDIYNNKGNFEEICLNSDCKTSWDVFVDGTGTTNYLAKWTGSKQLGNSIVYDDGSKVGIGTTSPSTGLTIDKSTYGDAGIDIKRTGTLTNYATLRLGGSDGNENFYLGLNNDNDILTINKNGNVGIGTTSPSYTLDVNGDMRVQGDNIYLSNSKIGYYTTGDAIYISNGDNAYFYDNGKVYLGKGDYSAEIILRGSNIRADANGVYVIDKLGVGTTSPHQKLEVKGHINITDGTGYADLSENSNLRITTPYGWVSVGPSNSGWSHFSTDRPRFHFNKGITVDTGLVGSYNENLQLQTSGTTRMTILNSNGNVGIGTTSPSFKLDVNSYSFQVGNPSSIDGGIINTSYESSSAYLNFYEYDEPFILRGVQTNTGNKATISFNQGKIGINTNFPSYTLDIAGDIHVRDNLYIGSTNLMRLDEDGNSGYLSYNGGIRALDFDEDEIWMDSGTIYVDATNNEVGISTTSPDEKLHIVGDVKIVSNSDVTNSLGSGALYILNTGGTQGVHIDSNEIQGVGTDLYINNDNAQNTHINNFVHVKTDGKVGIGITSPSYKLEVDGTGYFSDTLNLYTETTTAGGWHKNIYFKNTDHSSISSNKLLFGLHDTNEKFYWASIDGGTFNKYVMELSADTGSLSVDGGTFYVDGTNNRVGILDTTPSYELDVSGDIRATNDLRAGDDLVVGDDAYITNNIYHNGDTDTYVSFTSDNIYMYAGGDLLFQAYGAGDYVKIDGNTLYVDAANNRVGIGDSTPSYKLDVSGDIRATGDLMVGSQSVKETYFMVPIVESKGTPDGSSGQTGVYLDYGEYVQGNIIAPYSGTITIGFIYQSQTSYHSVSYWFGYIKTGSGSTSNSWTGYISTTLPGKALGYIEYVNRFTGISVSKGQLIGVRFQNKDSSDDISILGFYIKYT